MSHVTSTHDDVALVALFDPSIASTSVKVITWQSAMRSFNDGHKSALLGKQ